MYAYIRLYLTIFLSSVYFISIAQADDASQTLVDQADSLIAQAESLRNELSSSDRNEKVEDVQIEVASEDASEIFVNSGPKFKLKQIKLEGHFVYSGLDLSIYTNKYLDRFIYLSDLKKLSKEITDHYRSNGYITSRAYVPPQDIKDETALIAIREGLPGELTVDGNKYFQSSYYENTFALKPSLPLNSKDLELSLKSINRNQHIQSKLYLLSGETPGTTDLILKTEESNPTSLYYQWHNRGSTSTHHSRHIFHYDHDSLMGLGDSLRTAYILSEEGSIAGGYAYYSIPTKNPNLGLRASGSYFNSLLTNHFKSSEIKGISTTVTTGGTYDLIQTPTSLLQIDAGLEFKDSKTAVNDLKINMDRMRVATVGPRFLTTLFDLRFYGSQDTHFGIPELIGGSEKNDLNTTQTNTGGKFIYYTGSLTALKDLKNYRTLKVSTSGQWTTDNLTSLERFRMGGSRSIRAYPESDSSGDYGYTLSTEYKGPLPLINANNKSRLSGKSLGSTYQWIGFFDLGKSYNRERTSSTSVKDRLIMGAGFGIRVNLGKWLDVDMTYALPFGDPSTDKDRNQFFFSLQSGF